MKSVAMLLKYKGDTSVKTTVSFTPEIKIRDKKKINISVIGTGNFTRNYHIPNLARIDKFHLRGLCSASGVNAVSAAKLHGADFVTSNYHEILQDKDTDLVMIATRHDLHARIAIEAAKAGKDIFLEKPIAMTLDELDEVKKTIAETGVNFIAGYNRRHSQHAIKAKKYIKPGQPIMVKYTVNIQHLPDSHWTLDNIEGGGRLVGESDHFFDLMNYFTDSEPEEISAHSFPLNENEKQGMFNFMVQIKYRNNSLAQLTYTSLGGPHPPRENVEIFTGKEYVNIYNFSKLFVNGKNVLSKSDMGHFNELNFVTDALSGDKSKLFNPFHASEIALNAQSILVK
jgi:polar amino acid transport system substrate-binding protein